MATIFPTSVPAKRLSESITGASSSFKLNNIEGWDGSNLTSADLGTKAYAVFRNSAGTLMEIMEIDPSTIASASITILLRGLKFTGDLTTEVSANKLTWVKGDTIVELGTHSPQLLKHFVDIVGAQTIAGVKTFTSTPINTGGNPTVATELATKAYVDLIGTGSASYNKMVIAGTAGETLVAGEGIYLKTSDGRWWKWDADAAGTSENVQLGIAQGAGTAGNAITNGVLIRGIDTNQSGLSANTKYYVGNTAGALSSSAGTKEVTAGYAVSTTSIFFNPRVDQEITENQQDFLEVAEGGTDFYAASAAGTDTYAITVVPAPTAYANGQRYRFKADVANTGAATLNVNSLGAIAIKKNHDQDLATGDIEANQIVEVVYNSTVPSFQMQSQLATTQTVDIQEFTVDGTWTKPSGAKMVEVYCIGAGGGGGSGRREAAGVSGDSGGAGGGGGAYGFKRFQADLLGSTEAVTVGVGGAAGAAKSSDANGDSGSNGTASSFGTTVLLKAAGGTGGQGGQNAGTSTGGAGGVQGNGDISIAGGDGASGTTTNGAAGTSTATLQSPRGGGSGGGGEGAGEASGGAGGGFITNFVQAGGAGGPADTQTNGTAGTAISPNMLHGGVGGGGGSKTQTGATGGTGGAGGTPGGGGGGGAAARTTSGAGGAGGTGLVVVITYF